MDVLINIILFLIFLIVLIIALMVLIMAAVTYLPRKREKEFIKNYGYIKIGMRKQEIVIIMGDKYTQSTLSDGTEVLVWKCRHIGYTAGLVGGVYAHLEPYIRQVSARIKDNMVIEINSENMNQ